MNRKVCMDVAAGIPGVNVPEGSTFAPEEARSLIAAAIGALPEEIYFTAGSAEADALAVNAAVRASGKEHPHIITTLLEDDSVLEACGEQEERGAEVSYICPISTGRVEVAMIEDEVTPDTCLVSMTAANRETGTSEPFTGVGAMTSEQGIFFHLGAAYAYGKMPINVDRSHIDMLSADASCFGGPEGIGFLYARKSTGAGTYIRETMTDKEKISAMAAAAKKAAEDVPGYMERMRAVRDHLCLRIFTEIEDVELYGHKDHHLVNHLEVRFRNVSASVVRKGLAEAEMYAGIGSGSEILQVLGKPEAETAEAVRFSLACDVTEEDVDRVVDCLKDIVRGQRVIG